MFYSSIFPFWFLVVLFTAAESNAQIRASFGEPCSQTIRCDSRASLTCSNGSCECVMSDIMTYDGAKCTVFAGEKCTFTTVDVQSRGEERSWREELPCVKNSLCQDGFCTCLSEFYESGNRTCVRKSGFLENCEFDQACKTDQHLFCNENKTCVCISSFSTYDLNHQSCLVVANKTCDNSQRCVSNAKCMRDEIREKKVCKCDSDFFANPEGQCETKREYAQPCSNNKYCQFGHGSRDLQLVCNIDGLCGCQANLSVYDYSKQLCVRLVGQSCSAFPNCVDDSECSSSLQVCVCKPDYFQTAGTCERKRIHGKRCQNDEQCSADLQCDANGLCQCNKASKAYDITKQKCVGLADSPCSNLENDCVPNAYCNATYNRRGNCMCHNSYSRSQDGSCMVSHGYACDQDGSRFCSEKEGTICKKGVCKCKFEELQKFNSKKGKCISSVPGPCDRESIPCVENAHCSEEEEAFQQCKCNDGFDLVEGYCMLSIGQPCDYKYNGNDNRDPFDQPGKTCDIAAPLKCIGGTCQCDPLKEYDNDAMKCRGLVGSYCYIGLGRDDYCTLNAFCEGRRTSSNTPSFGVCKCNAGWQAKRNKRCILQIERREGSEHILQVVW